jgi:hypothetical protein
MTEFPALRIGEAWSACMHNVEDLSGCSVRFDLINSDASRIALGDTESGSVTFPCYGIVLMELSAEQTQALRSGRYDVHISVSRDGEALEQKVGVATVSRGRG